MRPLVRTSHIPDLPQARPRPGGAASWASGIAQELRSLLSHVPAPLSPTWPLPKPAASADGSAEATLPGAAPVADLDSFLLRAELSLTRRIRAHLPRGSLSVTLTDNRHTMISVRRDHKRGPRYRVRLHHMFADADPIVTRALARYIGQNDPSASRVLGAFIDSHQHRVRPIGRARALVTVETRGRHFDLQAVFDDLNRHYFDGAIQARITWGQRCGKPRRRNSIKMGSYSVEEKLIRVHRSLDRGFVPRYFVEWIVYHEMLHQVHEATLVNGRRQFHTPAFLADESAFEHYERARAWERAHLDEILTY